MFLHPFRRLILALAVLLAVLAPAGPALADAADIAAAARGVVRVVIIGSDGDEIFPVSHGTGFAVGGERFVTNAHVLQEAMDDERLTIGIVPPEGGDAVYARLVAVSPRNDLALLETTEAMGLPPLTIAATAAASSGAVTAIGYPMNVDLAQGLGSRDIFRAMPPVTSTGFLSGSRPSREFDTLLHTAPIARGNSGGPLVDDCGRVIGVNSFGTDGGAAEAEFYFAISTRELLPFLRANSVQPRLNALPCRSIEELEAVESERLEREREVEQARARAAEEALARRTEQLRRDLGFAVIDERANLMALALLLVMIAMGAGAVAVLGHLRRDLRLRAIAGSVALAALAGGLVAWLSRPGFADIETRLEEAIRAQMQAGDETRPIGQIAAPADNGPQALACVLDEQRSRITTAPPQDLPFSWSANGCVNGQTQYGLAGNEWVRVLVPGSEAAVTINRFDPAAREYVVERYLLDRAGLTEARTQRGQYQAPACGAGEAAARALAASQSAITAGLPQSPNERLVYSCSPAAAMPVDEP